MRYIVKAARNNILCVDGETKPSVMVGSSGYDAKIYSTVKYAHKIAKRLYQGRVIEINSKGIEINLVPCTI